MSFQVSPLPYEEFAPLFALDEAALAARNARLVIAESHSPCRVSLVDAPVGERLLFLHYCHQPAATPHRASHAIFVREHAVAATPRPCEIPPALAARLLSLRAFDAEGNMIAADVAEGAAAAPVIEALLAEPEAAYLHAHYARFGCYAARIDRV